MKIAYFDCFSGASGDMLLGALMDTGLGAAPLKEALGGLGLSHWDLCAEKVTKNGIAATRARVHIYPEPHGHHRHLSDIRRIIEEAALSPKVKFRSLAVFEALALAESAVHAIPLESVHFHEVGAMDAIIDVVGTVAGLELLGVKEIVCSPLHLGSGTVHCDHGLLPVPAPATAMLVRGKPVYATGVEGELLTPTGAALLTTLADRFGPLPEMVPASIGCGAGKADREIPNVLRLWVGEAADRHKTGFETDRVAVLETAIDDMNPQIYTPLMARLFEMGALDVYLTPSIMKKNRPGTLLTLLCPEDKTAAFVERLFRETTTIGLRCRVENRLKLKRRLFPLETPYGTIRVKAARLGEKIVNASPEYEDLKLAAERYDIPLKVVMETARALIWKRLAEKLPEADASPDPG